MHKEREQREVAAVGKQTTAVGQSLPNSLKSLQLVMSSCSEPAVVANVTSRASTLNARSAWRTAARGCFMRIHISKGNSTCGAGDGGWVMVIGLAGGASCAQCGRPQQPLRRTPRPVSGGLAMRRADGHSL